MAATGFVHPEFLIDTETLGAPARRRRSTRLRLHVHLDPRSENRLDLGQVPARAEFEKGHIPGAQFIDLQADLSDQSQRLRFMLPSAEAFAAAMSRFGVDQGTRVCSTAPPTRGGRRGCGGCCACSASITPQSSTAAGRSGAERVGRPKPARRTRAHRGISSSASSAH